MATTGAPNSMPYPVGTDKVVDGDDAIKALAERVDVRLGKWTSYAPADGGFNGAKSGSYLRTSEICHVRISATVQDLAVGAKIGLPFPSSSLNAAPVGGGGGLRQGQRLYIGHALIWDDINYVTVVDPDGVPWGYSVPVVWQPGDLWWINFSYVPASSY